MPAALGLATDSGAAAGAEAIAAPSPSSARIAPAVELHRWDGRRTPAPIPAPDAAALAAFGRVGGSHIVLQIDHTGIRHSILEELRNEVRRLLREARIGYRGLAVRTDAIEVRIRSESDFDTAVRQLAQLSRPADPLPVDAAVVRARDDRLIEIAPTPEIFDDRLRLIATVALYFAEERAKELGMTSPIVSRDGSDRIVVLLPGFTEPDRFWTMLPSMARLLVHFAEILPNGNADAPAEGEAKRLTGYYDRSVSYRVETRAIFNGGDFADATAEIDSNSGHPGVTFRLRALSARRFAETTATNVGRRLAFVIDNEVLAAPIIHEPVPGGLGKLTGPFTAKQAEDLASMLRLLIVGFPTLSVVERDIVPPAPARSSP